MNVEEQTVDTLGAVDERSVQLSICLNAPSSLQIAFMISIHVSHTFVVGVKIIAV